MSCYIKCSKYYVEGKPFGFTSFWSPRLLLLTVVRELFRILKKLFLTFLLKILGKGEFVNQKSQDNIKSDRLERKELGIQFMSAVLSGLEGGYSKKYMGFGIWDGFRSYFFHFLLHDVEYLSHPFCVRTDKNR